MAVHRASFDACVAVDALLGVDVRASLPCRNRTRQVSGGCIPTGQTSTQELSLVPMHGSAMTYAMYFLGSCSEGEA